MYLSSLFLQNFRNYSSLDIQFNPSGAVFTGINGSGKTNLLEAIHLLCTGRSQRSAQRRSMIRVGEDTAFSRGSFRSHEEQPVTVQFGFSSDNSLTIKVNDQTSKSFSDWFGKNRVVSFCPQDLLLIQGSPSDRRRFLNLVLSQSDDSYLKNLIEYKRDLQNRTKILSIKETGDDLDFYEDRMAASGSYIMSKRSSFFSAIEHQFTEHYSVIQGDGSPASVIYSPSLRGPDLSAVDIKTVFAKKLAERRKKDRESGMCTCGPHRDDFCCSVAPGKASLFASQGQSRALSICLRICSLSFLCHENNRESVMVLIDDAFCELDDERVSRIFPLIRSRGGQMFVTSTTPEIAYAEGIQMLNVSDGTVAS